MITGSLWKEPTEDRELRQGMVHVWNAWLDLYDEEIRLLGQTLSEREGSVAGRFRFETDRKRYIVAHGVLRKILSKYLGIDSRELTFLTGDRGKPYVLQKLDGKQLHFSLSHSETIALYAVTLNGEVGIDVEKMRRIDDADQVVSMFFSTQEQDYIDHLPLGMQREGFFRLWTCKEAVLKATGEGLQRPLNQVDISLGTGMMACTSSIAGDSNAASIWRLRSLYPAPNYVGALAIRAHDVACSYWHYETGSPSSMRLRQAVYGDFESNLISHGLMVPPLGTCG